MIIRITVKYDNRIQVSSWNDIENQWWKDLRSSGKNTKYAHALKPISSSSQSTLKPCHHYFLQMPLSPEGLYETNSSWPSSLALLLVLKGGVASSLKTCFYLISHFQVRIAFWRWFISLFLLWYHQNAVVMSCEYFWGSP